MAETGLPKPNRYVQIIEHVFFGHYETGQTEIEFERSEFEAAAARLGVTLPKNLGDLLYTFRYRAALPQSIRQLAPAGTEWVIRPAGRGRYRFVLVRIVRLAPSPDLVETKIPDATPGVIALYALTDEQALLAKLRYNSLLDIFTGVTCYSLQSHLRTQVRGMGQIETDEVYIGLDSRGAHYVFPVQAKGGRDALNVVQIEQDFALCAARFPKLICRPIGAQFMQGDVIALFDFEIADDRVVIASEKHYRLVPPDQFSEADLAQYRARTM